MDSERLARYLAGEASELERTQVDAWAASDAAHEYELATLKQVWGVKPPTQQWDVEFAWTKVAGALDRPSLPLVPLEPLPFSIWRYRPIQWLAAAGLIAAVGAGWWYNRSTTYSAGVGQPQEITLSDGSRVTLAPASSLRVEPRYGRSSRTVELVGRAWFEVGHDQSRPFRVRIGPNLVEDLGTEFEVDGSSAELKVAVMAGSVALSTKSAAPMTLGPKDVARVDAAGLAAVAHEVAVDRLITWKKGTLAFENRLVSDVLTELERWHEVEFKADTAILSRSFTGDLPTTKLDDALAIIGTSLGLTANRSGRTITLSFKATQ